MSNTNARDLANDRIPRQVMFWDGENYCAGFMIGNLLVCGCCGGTFNLDEVVEMAREDDQVPVRVFDTWVDISDEIMGDETEAMGATPLFYDGEEE